MANVLTNISQSDTNAIYVLMWMRNPKIQLSSVYSLNIIETVFDGSEYIILLFSLKKISRTLSQNIFLFIRDEGGFTTNLICAYIRNEFILR